MATYKIEVEALASYDVEADSEEEAKRMIPKHYSKELILQEGVEGSIFYEEFDFNNAKIEAN